MRIHMVGVSGTGMGALAALFREEGDEVSGSDVAFNPPVGPMLKTLGVRCLEGYDAANLDPRPDLVVVGNAIRRTNVEAQAVEALALEGVLAKTSMSAALRERFLAKRRPLVVAGTHGKTTTSAMGAWLLSRAGHDPGRVLGGGSRGRVLRHARARIAWTALERDDTGDVSAGWMAAPAAPLVASAGAAQAFDLFAGGVSCGRFTMCVPGHHNVRNAIAAIAACAEGFGA